ncbi:MAG TPA: hypothetical protein VHO90_14635, partial [Bacteroidales bacterium]|nr:hypothetical protein [Bacteroidales bacterium]
QLQKSLKLNQDEGVYFEIIKAKTAAFFAAACAAGASSTFGDDDQVQRIYNFGVIDASVKATVNIIEGKFGPIRQDIALQFGSQLAFEL